VGALLCGAAGVSSAVPAAGDEAGRSHPVEDPYYPAKSNPEFDGLHYDLGLAWDGTTLTGDVTIRFRITRSTDQFRLDLLHTLKVSGVIFDGVHTGYHQDGDGLVVKPGSMVGDSRHTVEITYAGKPHPVKAPSHRGDEQDGLGWSLDDDGNVFTFQEPYGAYTWYPVNDHPSDKAMFDAEITVPDGQTAVFNGVLESRHPNPGETTTFDWHLGYPVASYLTTIAIGPYQEHTDTLAGGTPATYWVLPRDESDLTRLKSQTEDAFAWLVKHAGPYPFDTFGTVVVGGTSAMETETMVTMSRAALDRPDAVVEHEMAHQWYGDAVSPVNWLGLWLNEGWAMWMQQAYEKYRGGYQYLGGMKHWRPYDEASRQASGPPGHWDRRSFGDLNVYLGPAMMLDRIRRRIGNDDFTRLSKEWVSHHEYGNVDRREFIRWVNAETGQNFSPLINRWLDSPHTPGGG
jgi:aminopeptidase N